MIEVQDLHFSYGSSSFSIGVNALTVESGETLALVGPSGSGKSTLLYLIAGILAPAAGRIRIGDDELSGKSDVWRRHFRLLNMGFIFQEFELLDYLDAFENILLPYRINEELVLDKKIRSDAEALARTVGLADRLGQYPGTLSSGEKQRVAICRALITKPKIVLADEPTSNLDAENARGIMDCIFSLVRERQTTLLMLTHDASLLERFDRVVHLEDLCRGATS